MVTETTKEREREKLLVTDAELLRRLGMPEKDDVPICMRTAFEIAHKRQLFLGTRF
jgi:hypothetical protein